MNPFIVGIDRRGEAELFIPTSKICLTVEEYFIDWDKQYCLQSEGSLPGLIDKIYPLLDSG